MRPYISLILPAYNESRRIAQTILQARGYFASRGLSHEILVAADGTDGTREVVAEMARDIAGLYMLGSPERKGKGHGIRQAVGQACGHVIGFADADDKTPIAEFDLIRPHLDRGIEVVIGSRSLDKSKIEQKQKLYRRIGSNGFWVIMQCLVRLPGITDTQCGFKFFQHDVAKDLFARQRIDGYMFDVEILHLARKAGYRIVQVPVRWRDDADSRLNLISGNVRNVLDLFRIRFSTALPSAGPRRDVPRAATGGTSGLTARAPDLVPSLSSKGKL